MSLQLARRTRLKPSTAAAPVFRDVAFGGFAGGTSAVITIPTTVQVGDLLILAASANTTATLTLPTGWTQRATGTTANGDGNDLNAYVLTRVAQAGDAGATVTVTANSAVRGMCGVAAYSGAAYDTAGALINQFTSAPSSPSGTSTGADLVCDLLCTYGQNFTTASVTYPGGVTTRGQQSESVKLACCAIGDESGGPGAWTSRTAGINLSANSVWLRVGMKAA